MCRRGLLATLLGALVGLFFDRVSEAEAAEASYHPGHNCPKCGAKVTLISGWRQDGRHYHRHGRTLWYH